MLHAGCRYAECRYAECRYAEGRYTECRYAECRYAGCRYAKRSGVVLTKKTRFITYPPGVDLIKLFWHKFTYSFCKLGLFIITQQIFTVYVCKRD